MRPVGHKANPPPAGPQTGPRSCASELKFNLSLNTSAQGDIKDLPLSSLHLPFLHQAEEFRTAVQVLLEWLSEAEQTLRFRGVLPEEAETLQALLHTHRDFMGTVEDKRADVNKAAGMGEGILTVCHPDSITTIKHWITIIRARFEEVRAGRATVVVY